MIFISLASRDREQYAREFIENVRQTCGVPFVIQINMDDDCIYNIPASPDVILSIAPRSTKVGAMMRKPQTDFDWYIAAGDDLRFIGHGWGKVVMDQTANVLHFKDPIHGWKLNTHAVVSAEYFAKNGYYDTAYKSFFPDTELTYRTRFESVQLPQIFEHVPFEDALMKVNEVYWNHDRDLFVSRFGINVLNNFGVI